MRKPIFENSQYTVPAETDKALSELHSAGAALSPPARVDSAGKIASAE